MPNRKLHPSKEYLTNLFDYRDGILYFRKNFRQRNVGDPANTNHSNGYAMVHLGQNSYSNDTYIHSNLVWIYHFGDIPDNIEIDHRNRNKLDDRIENLSGVSKSKNMENTGLRKDNWTGFKGIFYDKNREPKAWCYRISVGGKRYGRRGFSNKEDANLAKEEFLCSLTECV